tara:strand:+ start:6766 stop:7188 length:423 start_codon:yes stop_codon:yes gene_type:complete
MATRDYTKPNASTVANKDLFADLDLSFEAHPITGDIVTKKDSDAIKRAVRNILLTNHYERPFKPSFGSNLRGQLFELNMPGTRRRITERIIEELNILEPRIGRVAIQMVDEDNTLNITVFYQIIGTREKQQVNVVVSRVR